MKSSYKELIYLLFLSLIFALTVQQFELFKGNANHLIHSIKEFDDNKLQNDWIANQTNHLPFLHILIILFCKFFQLKSYILCIFVYWYLVH